MIVGPGAGRGGRRLQQAGQRRVSRPGVDAATEVRKALNIPSTARVIGTTGRLSEVKRQDRLIRALPLLRDRVGDAQLLLVGDGPCLDELRALAAELELEDYVHFAGYQSQPERFLAAMDVFALTSRSEGMPLAVLEAWAAGLAVVASRVGGLPEMIREDVTGLLFPQDDAAALVDHLVNLLRDRKRAAALGGAGRSAVLAAHSVDRMAREYHAQYAQVIREASREGT